jgi:hypothetical protein
VPDPGNDNNWSTEGILIKAFKLSDLSMFCGILTTKFCTDLCEDPKFLTGSYMSIDEQAGVWSLILRIFPGN